MGQYDDDERADAYKRHIYYEFANIVQHYDDTARPAHDDIDFDPADLDTLDGTDYDDSGDRVDPSGLLDNFMGAVWNAINEFGSFADIPDDYSLTPDETTIIDIVLGDTSIDNFDNVGFIVINIFKPRDPGDRKD